MKRFVFVWEVRMLRLLGELIPVARIRRSNGAMLRSVEFVKSMCAVSMGR